MNTIKLQKRSGIHNICYVLVAIIWIATIFTLVYSYVDGSLRDYLLQVFIFTLVGIFLTAGVCAISRWKLVFDEEGVTYVPMAGAQKRLTYREIQRVTIGQGYVIYDSSGSKWVAFADDSSGALQALNLMKARGVRVDLF